MKEENIGMNEETLQEIFSKKFDDFLVTCHEKLKSYDVFKKFTYNLSKEIDTTSVNLRKSIVLMEITTFLMSYIDTPDEIFKGGHIVIKDGSATWKKLKEFDKNLPEEEKMLRKRVSSHYKGRSENTDFEISTDNAFSAILVGTDEDGNTYLQMEGHPVKDLKSFILHMIDYIIYLVTGKNVGQYGKSENTEHNNTIVVKSEDVIAHDQEKIISFMELELMRKETPQNQKGIHG